MKTAYFTHNDCIKHDMGLQHPECPARISVIDDCLLAAGLKEQLAQYEAPNVDKKHLARVHASAYIDWVTNHSPKAGMFYMDGDTAMNPYTLDAALLAAGAAAQAVNVVMAGQAQNASCNVRPPGHHAGPSSAAGFCIFNNIAVAAAHALEHFGLQRVAIADFDVHHGNGTEAIFHDDRRVMLCSTFRHPYYPYCGVDSGNNHIINVPLSIGSPGTVFRDAIIEHWLPALQRFQPQLVLISAGFDAHREDSMGGLALDESDYVWVTEKLIQIADEYAEGRIVSVLEGGYALSALGRSVTAHVKCLAGVKN